MKRYTDFDQIDRDLKFLRLKSKIDFEEVKLSYNISKEVLADTLSPMNLIVNGLSSFIKNVFLVKIVDKLVGKLIKS